MHIGLIGGIGPAATEFYYRHLVRRHEAEGRPMELTIVHAHVHTLAANAIAGRAEAQAREYAALTARLKGAGAEAVAITSIGGHFCFDEFEPVSPLPVLNVAPAIAAGLRRAASADRPDRHGGRDDQRHLRRPVRYRDGDPGRRRSADDQRRLHRARQGRRGQRRRTRDPVPDRPRSRRAPGAEAVLLAGTDLFVAFEGHDPGYPTIDGALLHVDAIARASMFGLAAYPG